MNIIKITPNLSIVVQWDAVDDFLHTTYTIALTDDRDFHGVVSLEEQTPYTITGLTLDTVYTINVAAANTCGGGPEYTATVTFSTATTSTTISPTLTASTNTVPTVNPSSTTTTTAVTSSSSINTATITTLHATTVTTVINSSIVIPTAITYPSITTTTCTIIAIPTDTSTGGETRKFTNMITKCLLPTLP